MPLFPGTLDGSEPFNVLGNCTGVTDTAIEGEDCGGGNGVVRTQDVVSHVWSVTADNYDPGAPNLTDVVIEQTIKPSGTTAYAQTLDKAEISFEAIPVVCMPIAGGGINPPSEIIDNGDGSWTLRCNLGEFTEGQQKSFTATVKISGQSLNGSEYISSQRVYSWDADGNPNAVEATYADVGPIKISAQPAYDLVRSISPTQGFYNRDVVYRAMKDLDGDGALDTEPGYQFYGLIRLAAARKTGIEAIQQPYTFQDVYSATALSESGAPYDLEMYVTECRDNPSHWGGEIFGNETYYLSYPDYPEYHAINSGTCTFDRNNPADPTALDFTVTINEADLSGNRYPTKAFGSVDLSAGPYYAVSHRVQYWVPFRSIDMSDGVMDDQGSVYLSDVLNDFDPDSVSGVSNYGDDLEPGYNGAAMDGLRGNNRLGPTELLLTIRGSFSKRNLATANDVMTGYTYPGSGYHAGDGEYEPGQAYLGWVYYENNGTKEFYNPRACDVFDNTVQYLTDRSDTGATAGTYAYVGTYAPNGFDYTNYLVEYAHVNLTGDNPLDIDGDGQTDYDITTGRYSGTWEAARAARCDDDAPVAGWFADPNAVPGGLNEVNAVRVRLTDAAAAAGVTFEPGQSMRLGVPLKLRDTFYGGPYANQQIPVGTVVANFGSVRSDNWASGWTTRNYQPSPETGHVDGDRVTLTRIKTILDSESITPEAAPGNTASTLAGDQIVWKISSAVQSTIPEPSDAENLRIISVLPPEATYNGSCTLAQEGGTAPSLVEYNTDKDGNPAPGYTRLTWNFGDVTANTPIPPRILCTDTDSLAENGTSVVMYSEIRADNVITALSVRSDDHTIKLEQTGSIQVSKKVDMPLDDQNDDQVYTIAWSNFAPSFGVAAPTIIDVFSFTSGNGDGDAKDANGDPVSLSARTPESDFHGKFELTGAPTISWLDGSVPDTGAGDPDAELGTWYYSADAPETIDYNPDENAAAGTTNWCLEADFGSGSCPADFAAVTAIKFVSNYGLVKDGDPRQGMKATYTMQAGDPNDPTSTDINLPGDIYTNRFTFDSATLPADQYLRSNNVSVQIAAFSIGDLIFADVNSNGKYEAGVDGVVPNGVKVELYKVADDGSEAKVRETTTGLLGPGRYLFEPLASGSYYIKIPATEFQPGGKLVDWELAPPTGTDKENDDANEPVDQHGYSETTPIAVGVRTGTMTLSANPPPPGGIPTGNEPTGDNVLPINDPTGDDFSNLTLDIGLKSPLSSIGNIVWTDANNNGLQDVSEVGLSNVTVNLLDGDGNQLQTTRTDNNGYYNFSGLAAGDYIVEVVKPASYDFSPQDAGADDTADSDVDTGTGRTTAITLPFGQHDTQWDAGLYPLGSIGDRVWIDTNSDGAQNLTETGGIAGVNITLKDSAGNVVKTATTDADGKYLFTDLPPGEYTVDVDDTNPPLDGYNLTTANDPYVVSLAAGENHRDADFGYVNYASVGDRVWHDLNGNGVQDAGEPGIPGVTVQLMDATGGTILKTTATDAAGNYLFNDVVPGEYVIGFVKPEAYQDFVTANTPDDATDSDATPGTGRTATFTLAAGEDRTDIDAGLYQSATVGNFLWLDENGDNLQTAGELGLEGVSVQLSGTLGNGVTFTPVTAVTDENGQYQFSGLYPGDYIVTFNDSGFVTADQGSDDTLDSDVAANGTAAVTLASGDDNQTIDAGIAAASVTGRVWIDNNTENAIDEGTAAEQGVVGVTIKLIDPATGDAVAMTTTGVDGIYSFTGVNPGSYLIEVVEPANMGFVTQDQGDDLSDSDVNPATGRTEPFTLNAGDHVTDLDAGIEPGSLGDHVALDLNNNGIQDAGEPGVAGIEVILLDSGGNQVASQTTDATGFYNFTGVVPGNYTVHFAVPANMSLATANAGTDDTIDFDPDASGNVTVVVVSGKGNQTIDAGIVPATLGDYVWFDENGNGVQDAGEVGVADIPVTLVDATGADVLDAAGNPVTTATDSSGAYSFNVMPGTYGVKFTLPQDMTFTTQNVGGDDATDSDADPATGLTQTVTLDSGDTDNTLDAGIAAAVVSGTVLSDANGNGTQEAGDSGVGSVAVRLSGIDLLGQPVEMTVLTDANGDYQFNVLPGTYDIIATNPAGTTSSGAEQGTLGSTVINDDIIKVTVKSGETSAQNDFLDYVPASLSGQVRDDQDGDADLSTATDPGIAGVEVILWRDNDGNGTPDVVYANTTTNSSGDYSFSDLPPGNYVVVETDPDPYASTADTDGANNNRINVALASGESSPGHDFLDTLPANIAGQVRKDEDRDADLNDTEAGISGVTLTLYTDPNGDGNPDDGTVVTKTVSNAQGNYQFNNVLPGDYVVVETDPQAYESMADVGGANDNRVPVKLLSGTDNTGNDFLDASQLGSLSGTVWTDSNVDGVRDVGSESGIPNVTVLVTGPAGNVVATLTTDANGFYEATDLPAGNYTVTVVTSGLPEGALQTGDPDSSKDHQTVAAVVAGAGTDDLDFGYMSAASVGDTVWHDLNADGVQDADEPGVANVAVKLLDGSGTVVATTTTDTNGYYQFDGLSQGDYQVVVVKPENYLTFSAAAQGGDPAKDSDITDAAAGSTAVFSLAPGEDKPDLDAGLLMPASLGDRVWFDTNGNGVQDAEEPGVAGVSVALTDADGNPVATQTTDAAGHYLFEGLAPGDYTVAFILPAGMAFTAQDQGTDDAKDSDVAAGGVVAVTLASGEKNRSLDAGVLPAEITGRVWIDNDARNNLDDGVAGEDGVVGVNVNLIDTATGNAILTTTTGADGIYTFSGVPAGEYVIEVVEPANMGFVTPDQGSDDAVDSDVDVQNGRSPAFTVNSGDSITDIDAGIEPGELGDRVWLDENNNGLQDSGEPGVADVVVNLVDSNGTTVATQQTDDSGFYNFTGILPGDYTVNFTLPAGMDFAEQDRGTDDTLDSDVDVSNGNVGVTVVSGVGNQTTDAGVIPATIGDKVWFDTNGDGLQDNTETALAGVTVNLLDDNGNPVNDAAGNPVTTMTDENGLYSFTVLPGRYAVEVELPQGAALTQQDAGDEAKDSDADPATRQTAPVTVVSGDNLTRLDAGIQPATISGSVIVDNNANGTQDAEDTVQLPGVTVTITGTDVFGNDVTETVVTDADGNYTASLPPGTYTVTEATPDGYTSTGAEPGTLGSAVVDADTISVTVSSGETSENNDFLERQPASLSGQVRDDVNGDGDLSDTADAPVSGVEVILWSDTDQDGTPDAVVANTTTDSNGEYEFTGLAPGNYIVVESDPQGFVSTADTDGDNDNRIAVTLQSGEHSPGHDYLDTQIAGISGQVRDDEDRDANLDDSERGIPGVTIELYTDPNGDGNPDDGVLVATDSTDTQGNYLFNGIVPGNYVVVETDPQDYESTADIADANDNRIPVAHTSAQQSTGNDFLDTSVLGSLSGVVWSDTDPDGTRQSGESGIPNATVLVKDQQGVVVATLTTDGNGAYQANDLPAGNYTVEVVPSSLPEGSVQTGDPDPNLDHSTAAVVVSGENTAGLDFGYVVSAALGDTVWEDLNGNGVQDAGEPGIAGVAVELSRNGEVVATKTTDANGHYQFNKLIPGDYTVTFTTPNDFHITTADASADDVADSDIDAAGIVNVTLASADDLSVDAGFYRYGELGNKVWLDWNNNGVQDADEPAVSEVTVRLLDAAGNPVMADGVPVSAATDADGHYRFSELVPGDYLVEFVAPEGISFVMADQGTNDALDSDAQANGQAAAIVISNQYNQTVDAGIVPAAVSGRVWIDNNTANAIDDGTASENGVVGVTVNLIDNATGQVVATTTTGADGEYSFTTVLPGDYVVEVIEPMNMELVAQDQGGDDAVDSDVDPQSGRTDVFTLTSGDTVTSVDAGILPGALGDHVFLDKNENGLQDGGEPGIAGVTVNLINSNGDVVETTITDETGFYDFTAELPGEYTVQFTLPGGMSFTARDVGGDDTIDSDVNPADGTVAVTVVSDVNNQTIDAGVIPAKIGDTVWLDLDGDGTQGGQEPLIANVEVTLLDAAGNPALDKGGRVITTTTDEQGNYQFIVEPGTYGVQFNLPENTQFTSADAGGNDAADSDADPATGKTVAVTVNSGDHDTTLDAGIKPASISGTVLQDNNGDAAEDGADTPLSGVTVVLEGTDVFGNPVQMTATTDGQGGYHFDVPPGEYSITETNPETYVSSASEPGTVGSTVINADIIEVVVASGDTSANNDFLDYQPASLSGQVREDSNGDADTTDATDPALDGVEVMLWRDVDGDGTPDQVFANTTTDADGNYSFTDLPPGAYVVVETDPAGYQSTADTSGDNDNRIAVLLASGEHSPDHDFLDARPTMISGQVREDEDRDGNLTDADQGLEGVTVTLYTDPNGDGNPDDGEPVQTTTTNTDGNYVFEGVMPGDYVIVEEDPENYTSTADTSGEQTDNRIPVQNVSGENNTGNDLLDTKLAGSVSGVVWDDENADGVRDPGEPVFPGVTVTLIDGDGNETTVQTDPNGAYNFPDLIPGDYTVVVSDDELPENSQQTGDPDGSKDHQHTLTVQPQTDTTDVDFGYVVRGSIGDKVWHDLNANGVQDAGEPGIAGVEVQLLDEAGNVLAGTETAADGSYQFSQLLPGDYQISVELPAGYDRFSQANTGSDDAADSDVNQDGLSTLLTLEKAQSRTDVDAGLYAYASVGNVVWLDRNDDDLQQDGEPGVQNITVTLTGTDAEGNSVEQSVLTDVNGYYGFTQLVPGEYTLSFGIASPVAQDANANAADTIDSDIDASGKVTTTLTSGEHDNSIDAGVEKGRISDTVWEDLNGNGQQDEGEPGIPGVVVTLYSDPDGDGDPSDGEVLVTTATNQNGSYVFDGLLPDDYVVVFTTPEEYFITTQDAAGDDALDSDINPQGQAPVTIHAGDDADVDAGFWQPGSLGDRVWLDENGNGLQDAGEASVSDVTVSLYELNGQPVNDSAGNPYQLQTDAEGLYQFDGLEPGEYQVRFTVPAGITFTQTDLGTDDAVDSDANANGHASGIVTSGRHNARVDAGLVPASVTGRVWIDNNEQNGTDDGIDDEPGMVGIVVNLLDTEGNVVYSTTTGEDGTYTFAAVLPDEYQVEFVEPENIRFVAPDQGSNDALDSEAEVATGRTPFFTVGSGTTVTDVDAGIEPGALGDRVWLDVNENGIQDQGEPGVPGIPVHLLDQQSLTIASTVTDENGFYSFTDVVPGDYTVKFERPAEMQFITPNLGDDMLDSDVDVNGAAAVTVQSGISGDQSIDAGIQPAFVGDRVWLDKDVNDIQSEGEPGLANITVELRDKQGSVVDTTTTDADGLYQFAVVPGEYQVNFVAPDSVFSQANAVNDDNVDSDADASGLTHLIDIESGESDRSLDAGILPALISGQVLEDINGNGQQDSGDKLKPGTTVVLAGTDSYGNPVQETVITDANGNYQFIVPPGDYLLMAEPPAGALPGGTESDDPEAVLGDNTIELTVSGTNVSGGNDFLHYYPVGISGSVQDDQDGNPETGTGNKPLSGVNVALYTDPDGDGDPSDGVQLATTTTDGSGHYQFDNLQPGNYVVLETDPAGMVSVGETTGSGAVDNDLNDNRIPLTVVSGTGSTGNDFFDAVPVTVSGVVRDDENADGVYNTTDQPLAGVTVKLYTDPDGDGDPADGEVVQTVVTDAQGGFSFDPVMPGNYVVAETDPANYNSTADGQQSGSSVNDNRIPLTLASGDDQDDLYFLDVKPQGGISGQVQHDTDADGDLNDADSGVAGVTVELWSDPDGDGDPQDGQLVASVVTDGQGNYGFDEVPAGAYVIVEQDKPGYVSTADRAQDNDNRIPVLVSVDGDQHCETEVGQNAETLISCTGLDFLDRQLVTEVGLSKTAYAGHDQGAKCGTDAAKSEVTLVDIDKDLSEPVTYCFEVTNTGETWLADIQVSDTTLNLTQADLTLVGAAADVLAPVSESAEAKLLYYYEHNITTTLENTAAVTAQPAQADGTPLGDLVDGSDQSIAVVYLVFDPPSGIKTVTQQGEIGMEWQMVWINSMPAGGEARVTVYDEVPEGTHFTAMVAGQFVSADGVYCEARGQSVTETCIYEAPGADYPRGRVVWTGLIHGDGAAANEAEASHEVVIRFVSTLDEATPQQVIQNRAHSTWDTDGDGNPEFEDVTTRAPGSSDPDAPTSIEFNQSASSAQIPTLSWWAMVLMSLMMSMLVGWRYRRSLR
ncbi:MAG: SdrD B-like domain-containing protein [Thiolinea sp.]